MRESMSLRRRDAHGLQAIKIPTRKHGILQESVLNPEASLLPEAERTNAHTTRALVADYPIKASPAPAKLCEVGGHVSMSDCIGRRKSSWPRWMPR